MPKAVQVGFVVSSPLHQYQRPSLARRGLCFTISSAAKGGPWEVPTRRGSRVPKPTSSMAETTRRLAAAQDLAVTGVSLRHGRGANDGGTSTPPCSAEATVEGRHDNSGSTSSGQDGDPRRRIAAINATRRKDTVSKQKAYLRRLKAAGREGVWRRVPQILLEMRNRRVPRNVYVYNTAIAALARCRRPAEAEALLTAMLESDSVAPDKVSYNSAINAHARCGDLDAAHRLLALMRDCGPSSGMLRPDVITYNTVADAAAKRGDPVAAARVLAIMVEDGVQPDAITYNACLAACKATGDLRRAVVLLDLMRGDGVAPDQRSYSAVIATAGKRGDWSRVLDFMSEMRREGIPPDRVTFNTAIAAVAASGQWQTAGSLLEEMKADGIQPDPVTYTSTLVACGRAGEWRETLWLLEDMRSEGVPPNAYSYSVAIDACGKAGRQSEALDLLDQMRRDNVRPDTVAYNSAIDACSIGGDHETALRLLREMKEGTLSAPPPDVVSYGGAITACARAGRADDALCLVAELRANEARAAAPEARGGCGAREKASSGAWTGTVTEGALPLPNLVTYSSALFACLKTGKVARGGELLDEMIGAGIQPNDIHCDTMIAAWATAGEPERAVALVKRLQSHGFTPSLATYETLVWGFAQVADWEATVRALASILGLGLKPSVRSWDAAIAACSQAGHWERALALLADMRRQGIKPSRVTYTAAVAGLNRPRYANWGPKLEMLARMLQPTKYEHDDIGESAAGLGSNVGGTDRIAGAAVEGGEADGPSPEDYDHSIEALGDAGDAGGAACLLRVMRREGFYASPRAYRSVIYACARVGHLAEAVALAREMESSRRRAVAVGLNGVPSPTRRHRPSPVADCSDDRNAFSAQDGYGVDDTPPSQQSLSQSSRASSPRERGVAEEEEGDSGEVGEREFDLDVVYNCIVCNFARAVTRSGNDAVTTTSSSSSSKLAASKSLESSDSLSRISPSGSGGRRDGTPVNGSESWRCVEDVTAGARDEGLAFSLVMGVAEYPEGPLVSE